MHALRVLIGCVALALVIRPAAASEVLYDNSGFIQGQQSFDQSFALSGPGTLTVTLSNIDWPDSLASLNLLLTTPQGLLGPEMGAGTESFHLTGGAVFAEWFGTAQGPLDTGVYGLTVNWAPAPVPIPASVALLLSGLALLYWQRRRSGEMVDDRRLPAR